MYSKRVLRSFLNESPEELLVIQTHILRTCTRVVSIVIVVAAAAV